MEQDMEIAGCEISRLPEDLLAVTLSLLTTPRDAFRSAAASVAFRAAADSDVVWARFIPSDLPPLPAGELSAPPASKKELFLRLSRPFLLADGLTSMWLDRETGAKCYMLSARALVIIWGDTPQYWQWIPLPDSSFSEGAELLAVCWLDIRGNIQSSMLSRNSAYVAYFVFKLSDDSYGLANPHQETSINIGGIESKHQISLQVYDSEDTDADEQGARRASTTWDGVLLPRARSDGWMEVEMGEFCTEDGDVGEVCISLKEVHALNWKKGLIVQGIEIRPKK